MRRTRVVKTIATKEARCYTTHRRMDHSKCLRPIIRVGTPIVFLREPVEGVKTGDYVYQFCSDQCVMAFLEQRNTERAEEED